MIESKWERWLREAIAYSERPEPPKPVVKTLDEIEQEQFDRFTNALVDAEGFKFQGRQKNTERDERFFNWTSPLAYFECYSFEDKASLLFGSWGRKWCNLYIKRAYRRSGLLGRIFETVFRVADETSSTLFLEPKPYELKTKEEPSVIATVPRSLYQWDTNPESIERLT